MRLLSFAIFMVAMFVLAPLNAQPLQVQDKDVEIVDYAIAKSTIGRLFNIYSNDALKNPQIHEKKIYIPAGTPLALLNNSYEDSAGNTWHLAITYDGLLTYVIGENKTLAKPPAGFFRSAIFDEKTKGRSVKLIAVIQAKKDVKTEKYNQIGLTQSEVYAVADINSEDNKISLVLDKSKLGDLWRADEVVTTTTDDVAVLSRDVFLKSNEWAFPFLKYDPAKEAYNAIEDAFRKNNRDIDELKDKILGYLNSRFLDSKSCETQISFDFTFDVELGIDLNTILSPITAKLAMTGGVSGKTEYAKGEDFDMDRTTRSGVIYEIKTDRTRENCSSEPKSVRIYISGSDDVDGELTAGEIEAAGFSSGRNGFPLYTCRQEFFALRDILSNKYGLPRPIATFVIANKGEYRQTDNASKCEQSKVVASSTPSQ
ncbi:hypothetical protein [Mesorhizobium sp. IMUNJ 23232]|uniref:hypothetical protein n=1 Tax=Mesorhizobium sp. IMUNJ 23232 TaxID=3376064 RepID=UPI0037954863